MPHITFRGILRREEYRGHRERDNRVMCSVCGEWMRFRRTEKTPKRRRVPPHADVCTDCPIGD